MMTKIKTSTAQIFTTADGKVFLENEAAMRHQASLDRGNMRISIAKDIWKAFGLPIEIFSMHTLAEEWEDSENPLEVKNQKKLSYLLDDSISSVTNGDNNDPMCYNMSDVMDDVENRIIPNIKTLEKVLTILKKHLNK